MENNKTTVPEYGATPTLKVMRLQSPSLGKDRTGAFGGFSVLNSALRLPDSFGVIHIGETFTAYLGALNTSTVPVYNLNVKAALQTPSGQYQLQSKLDKDSDNKTLGERKDDKESDVFQPTGLTIQPKKYLSAVVERRLEEVGPHVLRVEVRYAQNKSIRKYYRFTVSSPLSIRESTFRASDDRCFVYITIENVTANSNIVIDSASFETPSGLGFTATRMDSTHMKQSQEDENMTKETAVQKYDSCGHLSPGAVFKYLFLVEATSQDASIRGIAAGDELGKAIFSWKKTMGEEGKMISLPILCPLSFPKNSLSISKINDDSYSRDYNVKTVHSFNFNQQSSNKFVIHNSGLSVDVAADSTREDSQLYPNNNMLKDATPSLSALLPVTVEPINPPQQILLGKPQDTQLLIINHSAKPLNLQIQFRSQFMSGVVICGESYQNLGIVKEKGGSIIIQMKILALVAGFFRFQGCFVVDLDSGLEVTMPSLFSLFVEKDELHINDVDDSQREGNTEINTDLINAV